MYSIGLYIRQYIYYILAFANRLVQYISPLMSSTQTAGVKNRCIQENIMFIKLLNRLYRGKNKPLTIFQVDFAKSFDSVCHQVLWNILAEMELAKEWIRKFMSAL